jgi:hypothetical protein
MSPLIKQSQALLAEKLTLVLIDVVIFLCCSPRAVGAETLGANANARHGDANSGSSSHICAEENIGASHRPDFRIDFQRAEVVLRARGMISRL